MASSFSTDLKIELMVTGENAGTWGDKTNTNLNLVQQAIAGFESISIAGGAQTTTLVMTDGALSNARNAVIKLTGVITGNQVVTIPTGIEKTYIVQNGTTGAFTVEFKQAGGTGPTFSTTDKGIKLVYADGTNVVDILTGPLSAVTIGGNLSVDGGTIKLDGNYPVGTNNVALGNNALDDSSLTGGCNVAIGTDALTANTSGFENIAVGAFTLDANTTGCHNVAVGSCALTANTTGCFNIGVGRCTLTLNTTGNNNTAIGAFSLEDNTTGNENHAIGRGALASNTTGSCNIAIGRETLSANTTACNNTAVGHNTLLCNTTGCLNTAVGSGALDANTTGNLNTAVGVASLGANTTGCANTAVGLCAMLCNTTGTQNTAVGRNALLENTTGGSHTAIGQSSMTCNTTGNENTAVGEQSLFCNTTGCNNVALGRNGLFNATTGSGNVGIAPSRAGGGFGPVFNVTTESNRIVMGHDEITNAYVKVAFTVTSDCRDKMNIASIPHGLCFVKQLNPVSFNFKTDRNTEVPNGNKRYGFLAQDIIALEGQNPVIIDNEQPEHLKYQGEALVPVLVNAIKELTAKVEALENKS